MLRGGEKVEEESQCRGRIESERDIDDVVDGRWGGGEDVYGVV